MKKIILILWVFLVVGVQARTNFVFMMADDVGLTSSFPDGGRSPYSPTVTVTPNIDSIAANGMRFTHFFTHSLCAPSRASIMAGREPYRTNVYLPTLGRNFSTNEVTFANVFQDIGFNNAVVAKWNLGDGSNYGLTKTERLELAGFATNLTFSGPTITYPVDSELPITDENYWPWHYLQFALQFIEDHKNDEEPFFLYYSFGLCHSPYDVGTPLDPGATNNTTEAFWAQVDYMDWCVGQVLDKLENEGLTDETFIIWTGDNGTTTGVTNIFNGQIATKGKSNYDLSGYWVPFFMQGPGISSGSMYTGITQSVDIPFTLTDLVGGTMPTNVLTDGVSFKLGLYGKADRHRDKVYLGRIGNAVSIFDKTHRFQLNNTIDFEVGDLFDVADAPINEVEILRDTRYEKAIKKFFGGHAFNLETKQLYDTPWRGHTNEVLIRGGN